MNRARDRALDALLDLHGQVLVVDAEGGYWVKFVVRRVPASTDRPDGLNYSFTLHGPGGERLIGFDNAHSVGPRRGRGAKDHRHDHDKVKVYGYVDAETLLTDFWAAVDGALRERGVIP